MAVECTHLLRYLCRTARLASAYKSIYIRFLLCCARVLRMTRLTEKVVRYGLRPLTFATPDALPRPIVHPDAAFGIVVQYAVAAKHASRTSSA